MATPTERIVELEAVHRLVQLRLDIAEKTIIEYKKSHADSAQVIADLRLEHETQLTLLEHKVEELRKATDTRSSRLFAVAVAFGSGILGGLLALGGQTLIRVWFGK